MGRWNLVCILVALTAQPALAAPAAQAAPSKPAAAEPALDPQRLALGREIARAFWPDGTMEKMMSSMTGMKSGLMDGMYDIKPKDLGVEGPKESDKTLGQLIREKDPHFAERTAIANRVIGEELGKVMGGLEPQMRDAFARIYAKRFTLAELNDIAAFFRSPSGKNFGEQMMPMMNDPEYIGAVKAMIPKLMQAMPDIVQKVRKATAHLPPPPKDGEEEARPAELPSS